MKKYFALNKNVILVKGYCRGVIQDLENRKIYSVDKNSKEYIYKLIQGISVEDVLADESEKDKKAFESYLDLLVEKKIGYYSDDKVISGIYNHEKLIKKELTTVWFELRKACNLRCCHCYMDCNSQRDNDINILSMNEWKDIIDQLKEYNPERIILIGGEPLLFKEIDDLICYCRRVLLNTEIVLYSNITLLNDKLIDVIVKNKVKVVTSIYSNNEEIHDKITGHIGSFDKTVSNIKRLRKLNVFVKANIVIMKYNCDNISDIMKFTYDITGVKSRVDIVRDVGESKKYLIPEGLTIPFNRIRTKPVFKGIGEATFIKNYSGNSCWQGKINISCDGSVSPCIMESKFINKNYNIRVQTLKDIIESYIIPQFWSISRDYIDECKDCEYRYVCKDCRPICEKGNNMNSKGEVCKYNPYLGIWNESK